ncbi:MAG: hypothetical protein QOI48_1310 [Solirubrobacteraceae bacterium]|nr:hypothetical protein [Solirubrobacteraceae bacterium]
MSMRSVTRRARCTSAPNTDPPKAVRRVVGQRDGLVIVRDAVNDGDRPERLAHLERHEAGEPV